VTGLGKASALAAVCMALAWSPAAPAQAPATTPAPAAAPTPENEGDSVVVSELTVHAPLLGPALWKVTQGDSEVYILGGTTPLPHIQT
jgi:hypothetical protein